MKRIIVVSIINITLLFMFLSCENNEIIRSGEYSFIKRFSTPFSTLLFTDTFNVYERQVEDNIIDILYHKSNETQQNIEKLPNGYRLIFSLYSSRRNIHDKSGLFYIIEEKEYEINKQAFKVYAFTNTVDEWEADTKTIIYYSSDYGFIAAYSIAWDNLFMLINLLRKGHLNDYYTRLHSMLLNDSAFFPMPSYYDPN